ncbi:hypothetical protein [Pseudoxanthomonas suwonensis]|uniref:hypothetical protein n=1 Tax=Pseudoxanthomonas suwonensis TaxID=314722 RepID=UPI001186C5D1|nr:hypothetical protein [Pseudoxanthomonas suwonensis]
MRTTKLHRVVTQDFPVLLAVLQSAEAVACAENEGWPIPEDGLDPSADLAGSSTVTNLDVSPIRF